MSRLFSINSLKQFRCRVLFSTDLTARGIDARNVNLVINADVAWDADTHLHRTGRAGRYGTKGVTVTVAAEGGEEFERLRKVAFKTGSKIWILERPGDDDEDDDKGEGDAKKPDEGEDKGKGEAKKPVDIFDFDGDGGSLEEVEPLECSDEDGKMLRSQVSLTFYTTRVRHFVVKFESNLSFLSHESCDSCTIWGVPSFVMFSFVFLWKFRLLIGLHNNCSISPRAGGTCQNCFTKHYD